MAALRPTRRSRPIRTPHRARWAARRRLLRYGRRVRALLLALLATTLVVTLAQPAQAAQAEQPAGRDADAGQGGDPRDGWRPRSEQDDPDEAKGEMRPANLTVDRRAPGRASPWPVRGPADGVRLKPPGTLRATGADLAWTPYRGKDIVEYQVHRSTKASFTPSAETLVAPLSPGTHRYRDQSAPAEPGRAGAVQHYRIAVRTTAGKLLTSPDREVALPAVGRVRSTDGDGTRRLSTPADQVTYHLPDTPARVVPGQEYRVRATLTNTTDRVWKADRQRLSYRWKLPTGKDVSTPVNQRTSKLPADLPPGRTVTFTADLTAPVPLSLTEHRFDYRLEWDLRDVRTGRWLSQTDDVPPSGHDVVVDKPTSNELGLEKFHSYAGKNTGAGSTLMSNLRSGNAVWTYNAFNNPSRGFATFVRFAYNAQDASSTPVGKGWSLQASSPLRLGSPLDFHPLGLLPTRVTMTDGDGTSHVFRKSHKEHRWLPPAGVHLRLKQRVKLCLPTSHEREAWELLRPDRTRFLFDCQGYPTAQVDKNGNRMEFTYRHQLLGHPSKQLTYITDATGRRTLNVEYWEKFKEYRWVDDQGRVRTGKHLLNPHLIGKVRALTDVSGRRVELTYAKSGKLARLADGAGSDQPKVFTFGYDHELGHPLGKLVRVTDPRGHASRVDYIDPEDVHDDKGLAPYLGHTQRITDRLGGTTDYRYHDPDGHHGPSLRTTVTDARGHPSSTLLDGYGRPTELTDAKGRTTRLGWDADNNVTRLEENNGAVSEWRYDPKTGYPLEIRDAEAVAHDRPATTLSYRTGEDGHIAELAQRVSPEGRTWRLGYDRRGNLTSVTDPNGSRSDEDGDYTTRYAYDDLGQLTRSTDPNGHTTTFGDYAPAGFPGTTTDPLGNRTTTRYDARGQVTEVTDATGTTTTQTYDVFGRPLEHRAPKDRKAGEFITTPAPEYDAGDNTVTFTAPNGARTTSTFDAADQQIAEIAPKDGPNAPQRKTTFGYDAAGNQVRQTSPRGNLTEDPDDFTTTTRYDEVNQPVEMVNPAGGRATTTFDDAGNVIEVIDPRKNQTKDPDDYTTRFAYDRNHQLTKTTDAAGHTTTSSYDWDGLVTATTDADGNRTERVLDARGSLVESREPHDKDGDDTVFRTTRYTYDQVGNRTKVITPRGVQTDDPSDFTSETVYDELNRVKETLTPYDPNDERYNKPDRTRYTYDALGRTTKVSSPPSAGQSVRNETRYDYFDNGWIKRSTDAYDIQHSYEYNKLGQQIQATLTSAGGSVSRTMETAYYPGGNPKSRSDDGVPVGLHVALVDNSDSNNTAAQGTWEQITPGGAYGYNAQTHPRGTGDARFAWQLNIPEDGKYEVFVRYPKVDGAATDAPFEIKHKGGQTERKVDQSQHGGRWRSLGSYDFQRDGKHAITLTDRAGGTVVADAVRLVRDNSDDTDRESKDFGYRYDANGNQTEVIDNSPGADVDRYTMEYDGLDQLSAVREHDGDRVRNTSELTYDANGNTLTTRHDLTWSKLEYDPLDRVRKITNADAPDADDQQTTTVSYTPRGELARQTKPNGNVVTYSYYLDGATKRQHEEKKDGGLVADHQLEYNANGHKARDELRLMDADDHGGTIDNTYRYSYDPQDRIAKVTKSGDSDATESYVHDAAGNVVRQTADGTTTTHTYDRNRLLSSSTDSVTTSYNYDPLGRLDTTSTGGEVQQRQRYDGFDRTASTTTGTGAAQKTKTFSYDPFDRTTRERTSGDDPVTKEFTYLGITSHSLREKVRGKSTTDFQYAPWGQKLTQLKQEEGGNGGGRETAQYTYHPHGDVEALTEPNGNTKTTYGYTAYGKNDKEQFSGLDKPDEDGEEKEDPYNSYRYNSQRYDTASGSYDMGFRTYDPGLNRFLTRDTYGGALADMSLATDPFTGNRYAFAGGNPISYVELDGHLFGISLSDIGHTALDLAGLVPGVGEVADLANCGWYAAEGNYLDAGLSCTSAVPFAGWGAQAAKWGKRADDAIGAARQVPTPKAPATPPAPKPDAPKPDAPAPKPDAPDAPPAPKPEAPKPDAPAPKPDAPAKPADPAPAPASPAKGAEPPPASGATCKVANSFAPGTEVLLADGSRKPIEEVERGERVAAVDAETGERKSRTVTDTITGKGSKHLVTLTVDTDGRAGDRTATLTATAGHPFWVPDLGRWTDAGELRRGDWLQTSSGTWVQVRAVQASEQRTTVHNLSVEGNHTYFVGAGHSALLVHNCGTGTPGGNANLAPGNNPAAQAGREVHNDPAVTAAFDAMGYQRGPTTGADQPDFLDPSGNPVELKPYTKSGAKKGTRQLRRYINNSTPGGYGELWGHSYENGLLVLRKMAVPKPGSSARWQWHDKP